MSLRLYEFHKTSYKCKHTNEFISNPNSLIELLTSDDNGIDKSQACRLVRISFCILQLVHNNTKAIALTLRRLKIEKRIVGNKPFTQRYFACQIFTSVYVYIFEVQYGCTLRTPLYHVPLHVLKTYHVEMRKVNHSICCCDAKFNECCLDPDLPP